MHFIVVYSAIKQYAVNSNSHIWTIKSPQLG